MGAREQRLSRRDFLLLSGSTAIVTLLAGLGCNLSGATVRGTPGTAAPTPGAPGATMATPNGQATPPLYLTIIVHNEEDVSQGTSPKPFIPDYDGDEALMLHFGMAMREFGKLAQGHGARINFGSDWTFSRGVARYDPTFYTDLEAMGHEIDAHAHESFVLYHEVREDIVQAGGHPTHVVSGMNENAIQRRMDYFDQYYPEFQILWGVSLPGHGVGECIAPWVWRPSRTDWLQHDPDGKYIYIGHGELLNSVEVIQAAVAGRKADRVNTYAVLATPRGFKAAAGTEGIDEQWTSEKNSHDYWENRLEWWDDFLTEVDAMVQRGDVQYASLTEVAEMFTQYENELRFDFEDVPRSDAPLLRRSIRVGYEP